MRNDSEENGDTHHEKVQRPNVGIGSDMTQSPEHTVFKVDDAGTITKTYKSQNTVAAKSPSEPSTHTSRSSMRNDSEENGDTHHEKVQRPNVGIGKAKAESKKEEKLRRRRDERKTELTDLRFGDSTTTTRYLKLLQ
jgi:hypothetical protein